MSDKRQTDLRARFDNTPVYRETIREVMMEKVDLGKTKQIMQDIKKGKMQVTTYIAYDNHRPCIPYFS